MSNDIHPQFPLFTRKQVQDNPILRCFNSGLPPHLAAVAHPFAELAQRVINTLPPNAERTTCLRKIREAKDCAVTALVWQFQIEQEAAAAVATEPKV